MEHLSDSVQGSSLCFNCIWMCFFLCWLCKLKQLSVSQVIGFQDDIRSWDDSQRKKRITWNPSKGRRPPFRWVKFTVCYHRGRVWGLGPNRGGFQEEKSEIADSVTEKGGKSLLPVPGMFGNCISRFKSSSAMYKTRCLVLFLSHTTCTSGGNGICSRASSVDLWFGQVDMRGGCHSDTLVPICLEESWS